MNRRDFKKNKEEIRKLDLKSFSKKFGRIERNIIANIFWGDRIAHMSLIPKHTAWVNVESAELEGLKSECIQIDADLEAHNDFLKKREQEFENAKKTYEDAKRKLETAQAFHEELIQKQQRYLEKIERSNEKIKQMDTIVLVHNSSTIGRVEETKYSYFITTEADAGQMEEIGLNDIFNSKQATDFIEIFPSGFEMRHTNEERNSIIEYCELVINVMMQESSNRKIKLLYAEPDIAEILRLNGVEI